MNDDKLHAVLIALFVSLVGASAYSSHRTQAELNARATRERAIAAVNPARSNDRRAAPAGFGATPPAPVRTRVETPG